MRVLATAARGLLLALLCVAPAWAANPLVGNWSSTVDWDNQAAGLYQVMSISANGQIHIRVMNHKGMAFDVFGTYKMDATGKTMRFTWTSYSPKQICVGGNCTPMRSPYPLGVAYTSRIQFQNANSFIGTTSDGTSTNWLRMY